MCKSFLYLHRFCYSLIPKLDIFFQSTVYLQLSKYININVSAWQLILDNLTDQMVRCQSNKAVNMNRTAYKFQGDN